MPLHCSLKRTNFTLCELYLNKKKIRELWPELVSFCFSLSCTEKLGWQHQAKETSKHQIPSSLVQWRCCKSLCWTENVNNTVGLNRCHRPPATGQPEQLHEPHSQLRASESPYRSACLSRCPRSSSAAIHMSCWCKPRFQVDYPSQQQILF